MMQGLLWFVAHMGSNNTQGRWTKQDSEDAARLLAKLVQRSKKAGGDRPTQITDSREVRGAAEKVDRETAQEMERHQSRSTVVPGGQSGGIVADTRGGGPASAYLLRGEDTRRRLVFHANDNDGQVLSCFGSFTNQTARPIRDVLIGIQIATNARRSRVVEL